MTSDLQCLLGQDTVRRMNLLTVNSDAFIAAVTNDNLDHLGYALLTVDPAFKPRILPGRWSSSSSFELFVMSNMQEDVHTLR